MIGLGLDLVRLVWLRIIKIFFRLLIVSLLRRNINMLIVKLIILRFDYLF
jgi:hypothetical protein